MLYIIKFVVDCAVVILPNMYNIYLVLVLYSLLHTKLRWDSAVCMRVRKKVYRSVSKFDISHFPS